MDASEAKSLTEKQIARSNAKFMKKFARRVERAAKAGKTSVFLSFDFTAPTRVLQYQKHLADLGYRTFVSNKEHSMIVEW